MILDVDRPRLITTTLDSLNVYTIDEQDSVLELLDVPKSNPGGPPNEEALAGHPLAGRVLRSYAFRVDAHLPPLDL